jgi:uncharacterized SAM-binding protein YcdF (DUF218 family)
LSPINGLIIILGSPNTAAGELYSIGRGRAQTALAEYAERPGWKFLLTGGFGPHFNTTDQPHALYLKQYLLTKGVPEADIVEFAVSTNTLEDAKQAKPIVLQYGVTEAVVVTSDFHLARASYIFEREFADTDLTLRFIGAETDESTFEFDLAAQQQHERQSLAGLKAQDAEQTESS